MTVLKIISRGVAAKNDCILVAQLLETSYEVVIFFETG